MRFPPVPAKTAIVTGCSTGIGAATARLLVARGWKVAATARRDEDLAGLQQAGCLPVRLDVLDPASVGRAAEEALAGLGGTVGAVVNNAGVGQVGAIEDLTRESLRYQFDVNLIGMLDFSNRFMPALRRQGAGRLVFVSSVLGRISMPFYGAYCGTKFAMEAMADAMRVELWGSGVGVILVEPGPITSAFRDTAVARARASLDLSGGRFADLYRRQVERREQGAAKPEPFTLPPEAVAGKILRALESASPRRRYRVTVPAYLGAWSARLCPAWILDAAMRARKSPRGGTPK